MILKNQLKLSFKIFLIIVISIIFNKNNIFAKEHIKEINNSTHKNIILIDPGHGGLDGGAVSKNGTVEKDVNLQISQKLKEELEKNNFKVVMTRKDDNGLYSNKGRIRDKKIEDLNNRCKMKVDSKCDMFISIHLNMFPQSKYYGAQVWYSKQEKSREVAHIIQQNLIKDLNNNNNRQEKFAKGAYKVLRAKDVIPSVIVECGFLSNPKEELDLKKDEYQYKIAKSLSKSIKEFFEKNNIDKK